MYSRNNTQAFMDVIFTQAEHKFIMREARRIDASKLEAHRRREQIEWDDKFVEANREKEAAKKTKEMETFLRLSKVVRVSSMEEVAGFTNAQLDEQLDVLRRERGNVYEVPLKSRITRKDQKMIALKKALEKRGLDTSNPGGPSETPGAAVDASLESEKVVPSWEEEDEAEWDD